MNLKSKWCGNVNIPEGQINDYRVRHIKHEAGACLPIINQRTALFSGSKVTKVTFAEPTTWHELSYDGGVWMTDQPIEQYQHDEMLTCMAFADHVLVGGLGLGYAVTTLVRDLDVSHVTVVDVSDEVIRLVWPHIDPDVKECATIVNADLFDYLDKAKADGEEFDYAFYDIWQSDGERTFFKTVCPLREKSVGIVSDGNILCWNEDIMRGQLYIGLVTRIQLMAAGQLKSSEIETLVDGCPEEKQYSDYFNWSRPLFKAIADGRLTYEEAQLLARDYVDRVGRPLVDLEMWLKN